MSRRSANACAMKLRGHRSRTALLYVEVVTHTTRRGDGPDRSPGSGSSRRLGYFVLRSGRRSGRRAGIRLRDRLHQLPRRTGQVAARGPDQRGVRRPGGAVPGGCGVGGAGCCRTRRRRGSLRSRWSTASATCWSPPCTAGPARSGMWPERSWPSRAATPRFWSARRVLRRAGASRTYRAVSVVLGRSRPAVPARVGGRHVARRSARRHLGARQRVLDLRLAGGQRRISRRQPGAALVAQVPRPVGRVARPCRTPARAAPARLRSAARTARCRPSSR